MFRFSSSYQLEWNVQIGPLMAPVAFRISPPGVYLSLVKNHIFVYLIMQTRGGTLKIETKLKEYVPFLCRWIGYCNGEGGA